MSLFLFLSMSSSQALVCFACLSQERTTWCNCAAFSVHGKALSRVAFAGTSRHVLGQNYPLNHAIRPLQPYRIQSTLVSFTVISTGNSSLNCLRNFFFTKRRTCANTAHPNRAAFKICTNISMTDVSASLRVFHASIATPVPSYVANECVNQACATTFKRQCQLIAPTITYDHAKTSLCSIHIGIAVFPKFNFTILFPLKALGAVLQNGLDFNMVQQNQGSLGPLDPKKKVQAPTKTNCSRSIRLHSRCEAQHKHLEYIQLTMVYLSASACCLVLKKWCPVKCHG